MLAEAAVSAAVRSLTDADRSARARCNSALADVSPATSPRDFAKSSRVANQLAANAAARRQAAVSPVVQGQTVFLEGAGGGGGSGAGAGIELRTSLTMREAKLSRLATMKRRTSAAWLFTAVSTRRPQSTGAPAPRPAGRRSTGLPPLQAIHARHEMVHENRVPAIVLQILNPLLGGFRHVDFNVVLLEHSAQ